MAELLIDSVVKDFGQIRVLHGLSLDIAAGEFIGLLGPSGCGKTTLLRIIAGLETVSSGTVRIGGTDVTHLAPEDRDIAMMFQSYALFPHMNVAENVRFPLRMRGRGSRAEQAERVRAALDAVQMGAFADRLPQQLSGGQQQRVALARAIVSDPKILLLDEPLSNLDARLREDMQVELIRLHHKLGLTTVFVTHDQTEALSLSDRVVLMREGRIEQQGTPQDIYARPHTSFGSRFLGSANVIPVRLEGGFAVWPGGMRMRVETDLPDGAEALLVLRQEDVGLSPLSSGNTRDADTPKAVVGTRVFMGGQTRYVLEVGGVELRTLAATGKDFTVGEEVAVDVPMERRLLIPD